MSGVFTQELIERLGWTLLHFLWQGLGIAIVLAILLQALRKASPNYRYMAGCVALMVMIVAPVATYISLTKQQTPALRKELRPAPIETAAWTSPPRTEPIQVIKMVTEERKVPAPKPSITERLNEFLPLLVSAWAIGVVILSLRLTAGWLGVSRLKHLWIKPAEEAWHRSLAELVNRMCIKQSVRLAQSVAVEVPTVIGWLRPIILMPAACLAGLSPSQVEYILAHELAHVRRNDYLVNLLQCLAETILFYHPAVWWVSRRIREEREHCCDDIAVSVCGDRLEYARTLAALEELRGSQSQLVMAAAGAPLLQRIRRLLGQPERTASRSAWPMAGVVIMVMVVILTIGLRSSRAVADQTQETIRGNNKGITLVPLTNNSPEQIQASQNIADKSLPQIHFESKFFEVEEKAFPKDIFNLPGASNALSSTLTPHQVISESMGQRFLGVLTEPEYRAVVNTLEMANNSDKLNAPAVTTESGRQAQIQAVDIIDVLTNASPNAPKMRLPFGLALDLIPSVTPDKLGVQLKTIATVTRLLDAPTVVSPRVHLTQLTAETTVQDGQTLVMAGLMPETVTNMKDKVPVLGDLPLAGGLFRSETVSKSRRYLIVFVTPTLIHPDGSRVHSEQELSAPANTQNLPPETLLFETRLLLDAGKIEEAETTLDLVSKLDPQNPRISHFRQLIADAKKSQNTNSIRADQIKSNFNPTISGLKADIPLRFSGTKFTYTYDSKHHESTNEQSPEVYIQARPITVSEEDALKLGFDFKSLSRLKTIIIPSVRFDKQPLQQVLENLTTLSKLHDPEGIGIPLFVNLDVNLNPESGLPYTATPEHPLYATNVLVNVELNNAPLADVLEAIIQGAEKPLKYAIEDRSVVFDFKDQMRERMYTRIIPLDVQKFEAEIKTKLGLTFDEAIRKYYEDEFKNTGRPHSGSFNSYWVIDPLVRNYFIREGLDFDPSKPANMGKSLFFNNHKRILFIHSNMKDLELVEKIVEKFKAPPAETEKQPSAVSNLTASTNLVSIRNGRKEIQSKLDRIRIDSVKYDGLPLVEVINNLSEISRTRDPDKKGINFFINREAPAAARVPGAVDAKTGLPHNVAKENGDPATLVLKMPPAMTNVPLNAVLDCIATNNSLLYTIEDYAVVFSLKDSEPLPLFWKTYKLDLEVFNRQLHLFSPEYSGTNASTLTNFLSNLFQTNGIDFSPTNPANSGKSIGFNSRGLLAVRATRRDFDLIEKLLAKINTPPQIQIKTRFLELNEEAARKLKLDTLARASGAKTNFTIPKFTVPIPGLTVQTNSQSDATSLTTNSLVSQFTGVLTPELSKEVLARVEKTRGVGFFPLPDVTTENNCQAQVQAVDIKTIVTGLTTVWTNGTSTNVYSTQTLPFGPVLDLIPKLSEDNSTIEMNIIGSVTEFLGYDDPASLGDRNRTDAKIPLPKFKLRQFKSSVDVSDGETIVLMGKEKANAAPQGKSKPSQSRQLIIFITPTLINPDGSTYNKVQKL